LRKFVVGYIADALAYRQVPNCSGQMGNTYDKIHGVVHEAVTGLKADLGDGDKPVIVIAHSLGSVIMSNYIWDRQKEYPPEEKDRYGENPFERMETLAGFITFGSPLSLFALAFQPRISFEFL
jgi:alpha-beta hydrolase superfamily lysophospholipase